MSTCVSGKKVFLTQQLAEDALIEAWGRYNYTSGNGPISFYKCEDCGYYHFTSQGTMNERLAKEIASGKIKLQREASHWERKIKK
jgi:hypothetical protein